MQQHQNNDLDSFTREKKQGLAISVVIHFLLALFIIFASFKINPTMPVEVEEGLLVNFGYDNTGEGLYEPAPMPEQAPVSAPTSGEETLADEALLTQDFEEAVEVKKSEPSPEELKKIEEARVAEQKKREAEAAEKKRIEQENAERLRREEEQRKLDQIKDRTRNAFGNAGNTGTTGTSEGIAGGEGNQGVESGSVGVRKYGPGGGVGDGKVSYSLGNRQASELPTPVYNYQGEGIVVVEISVDRNGKVTKVTAGVKGSTTLDEYLLKAARDAAMKAKFEANIEAPLLQKGTITYNFKLK